MSPSSPVVLSPLVEDLNDLTDQQFELMNHFNQAFQNGVLLADLLVDDGERF